MFVKSALFLALLAFAPSAFAGAPQPQCIQVASSGCSGDYPVDCGDWCCASGYSCCGSSIRCCSNCVGWPGSTPRYLCCGSGQFGCVDANDNIWCCDNGKSCGAYGQCN